MMHLLYVITTVALLECSTKFHMADLTEIEEQHNFPHANHLSQRYRSLKQRETPDTNYTIDDIPIAFLGEISLTETISEFSKQHIRDKVASEVGPLITRMNSGPPFAKSAGCRPELTVVPIELGDDPLDFVFPSCIRIQRCGGCCPHPTLKCHPTSTAIEEFKVMRTRYLGPKFNKLDEGHTVVVNVTRHVQCDCVCSVQREHCRLFEDYDEKSCRCICKDPVQNCPITHYWDKYTCSCQCHHRPPLCSTGFVFNNDTCMCKPSQ